MEFNIFKKIKTLRMEIKKYRLRRFADLGAGTCIYLSSNIYSFRTKPNSIKIGNNCHIRGDIGLFRENASVTIGDYCYLGEHSKVWAWESVCVGDRVLISHNVNIFDSETHPIAPNARARHFKNIINGKSDGDVTIRSQAVTIENDVWIGCGVTILKGVTIGYASVIAAGSIVTRSVQPMSLYAGNPARLIRSLEDEINN